MGVGKAVAMTTTNPRVLHLHFFYEIGSRWDKLYSKIQMYVLKFEFPPNFLGTVCKFRVKFVRPPDCFVIFHVNPTQHFDPKTAMVNI